MNILAHAEKVLNIIFRTMGQIGIGVLVAMMLITVADVFMRYVFNKPIVGTTEIIQFTMLTLSFLGLVWCTMLKGHIKVDLLTKYIPYTPRLISESVFYLLGLGLYALICWRSFIHTEHLLLKEVASEVLDIPVPPFYLVIVVASGCVTLILLIAIIRNIIEVVKK